jgi:hypothetical protein
VAKKVIIPIHLDVKEREILRLLGKRDGTSMADVVRRLVRSRAHEVLEQPRAAHEQSAVA